MEKLDLSKAYKAYYTATTKPRLVNIEAARFLSVLGKGDPSQPDYGTALQALYATAYALKFLYKAKQKDFVVAKLEGLWWFDETTNSRVSMTEAPQKIPRSEWQYRMLIRLPAFVAAEDIKITAENVAYKKQIARAASVELFEMEEGLCVQMLHIGPFDKEPESLLQIQAFSEARQLQRNGLHHEIYLSDFNKTAPEKLKTILREPVKKI
ncbi:GyrI-like domain-containing protein [Emticicia sp. TH156]|uniref:GyrI-like domain-containing protein n=1 Tax=Emticicia sp. TH156 TaxID=2067454 RepID=UPI000C78B735|nr:GyrI-like domain-containing protein [Emticicia sp. TH156]PLK46036.1 hypothetical protein C0V77_01410 [Emticicia sp. TH156]